MDIHLLNRKQLAALLRIDGIATADIINDLSSKRVEDFTSINLSKSCEFDNYPLAHRHCYDTFFKGADENSLSSELYVQYSFTEQSQDKTVDAEALKRSGATVKSRLRRLQKDNPGYIAESDDTRYTELTAECPPSVRRLIEEIRSFGDVVTRVRLAGLAPGHAILPHRDHDPTKLTRIHIPIATNSSCVIECENSERLDVSTHLEQGGAYLLNTGRRHAAKNDSGEWRVHLLIDIHGQNFLQHYKTSVVVS